MPPKKANTKILPVFTAYSLSSENCVEIKLVEEHKECAPSSVAAARSLFPKVYHKYIECDCKFKPEKQEVYYLIMESEKKSLIKYKCVVSRDVVETAKAKAKAKTLVFSDPVFVISRVPLERKDKIIEDNKIIECDIENVEDNVVLQNVPIPIPKKGPIAKRYIPKIPI
jgi:hypothetical protein